MRFRLTRLFAALIAASGLAAGSAAAAPSDFAGALFGVTTARDGSLLVADDGQGIVRVNGRASLVARLPGVVDVALRSGGGLWAITSGEPGDQKLYRVVDGRPILVANLYAFEAKRNPDAGEINSNPFDVADLGHGRALVADAGGNDVLKVNRHGKVKLVAVLPNEVVSTANAQKIAGCPDAPPDFAFVCDVPTMPAEPVPTSLAIGPDGAFYVGELKGIPAPIGESRVWRIERNARNARCGRSPRCSVALDGFTSIIDLAFGPDGRLNVAQIDDASWLALEAGQAAGGSVHACALATLNCETVVSGVPILTAITYRPNGSLWGTRNAFIPGAADVVRLAP